MKVRLINKVMLGGAVIFDEGEVSELVNTVIDRDGCFCGVLVGRDSHLYLVCATDFIVDRSPNPYHGSSLLCENSSSTAII